MLRWSESFLLLPPLVLAVVAVWTRAMPSRTMLLGAALALGLMAAALVWFGAARGVDGAYVPARLQHGHIEPGHGGPA